MLLHPTTRLRHDVATIYLNWDGSYTVAVAGHVVHPDGERSDIRRGHAHTLEVGTEAWAHLTHGIAPAFDAHYAAEGLEPPEPRDLPLHLHPHVHGLPSVEGTDAPPLPETTPAQVQEHLEAGRDDPREQP